MFEDGDVAAAYNKEMRIKAAAARAGITRSDSDKSNLSSIPGDSNNVNVPDNQKPLNATATAGVTDTATATHAPNVEIFDHVYSS
ncbi:unnamed protein product [Ambrosiozyma monospora]|uniref:Unnamed protein product n=1 Tax=Ambrosiozyma monospora TaxID=43982 RepID=A0ACB5T6A5_AMBMO|nr:unnamed protein product [Ambrosiozyma monospora]